MFLKEREKKEEWNRDLKISNIKLFFCFVLFLFYFGFTVSFCFFFEIKLRKICAKKNNFDDLKVTKKKLAIVFSKIFFMSYIFVSLFFFVSALFLFG